MVNQLEQCTSGAGASTRAFIIEFDSTQMDALHEQNARMQRNANRACPVGVESCDDDVSSMTSMETSTSCSRGSSSVPLSMSSNSPSPTSTLFAPLPLSAQPLLCPILPMPQAGVRPQVAAKRPRVAECSPRSRPTPSKRAKMLSQALLSVDHRPKNIHLSAPVPFQCNSLNHKDKIQQRSRILKQMKEYSAKKCNLARPPSFPRQLVLSNEPFVAAAQFQSRPGTAVSHESHSLPMMHFVHHAAPVSVSAPEPVNSSTVPVHTQSSSFLSMPMPMVPQLVETEHPEREAVLQAACALLQQKRCLL